MNLSFNLKINYLINKGTPLQKEIINDFFNKTLRNKYLGRRTPDHILVYKGINFELINISVIVKFTRVAEPDKTSYREILNLNINKFSDSATKSIVEFRKSFYDELSNQKINVKTITKVSIKILYK